MAIFRKQGGRWSIYKADMLLLFLLSFSSDKIQQFNSYKQDTNMLSLNEHLVNYENVFQTLEVIKF